MYLCDAICSSRGAEKKIAIDAVVEDKGSIKIRPGQGADDALWCPSGGTRQGNAAAGQGSSEQPGELGEARPVGARVCTQRMNNEGQTK